VCVTPEEKYPCRRTTAKIASTKPGITCFANPPRHPAFSSAHDCLDYLCGFSVSFYACDHGTRTKTKSFCDGICHAFFFCENATSNGIWNVCAAIDRASGYSIAVYHCCCGHGCGCASQPNRQPAQSCALCSVIFAAAVRGPRRPHGHQSQFCPSPRWLLLRRQDWRIPQKQIREACRNNNPLACTRLGCRRSSRRHLSRPRP